MSADRYITLVCSLPAHGELFKLRRPSLSESGLQQRRRMLEPDDRATLDRILDLLSWSAHPLATDDAAIVAQARELVADLDSATLIAVVEWFMEGRSLVAAMRKRRRGESAPEAHQSQPAWGYGRWQAHMIRHWDEPDFGLGGVFPWAQQAARLLDQGDALGLERLLLAASCQAMNRFQEGHWFDFESVVIYMLRRSLARRWTAYSGDAAVRRFHDLVDEGLAGHA
jgi:hypothetical protein